MAMPVIYRDIMLGALITRFAVMFSDTGPAQPYEEVDAEESQEKQSQNLKSVDLQNP